MCGKLGYSWARDIHKHGPTAEFLDVEPRNTQIIDVHGKTCQVRPNWIISFTTKCTLSWFIRTWGSIRPASIPYTFPPCLPAFPTVPARKLAPWSEWYIDNLTPPTCPFPLSRIRLGQVPLPPGSMPAPHWIILLNMT